MNYIFFSFGVQMHWNRCPINCEYILNTVLRLTKSLDIFCNSTSKGLKSEKYIRRKRKTWIFFFDAPNNEKCTIYFKSSLHSELKNNNILIM